MLSNNPSLLTTAVPIGNSYFEITSSDELLKALAHNKSRFEEDWEISVKEEIIPQDITFETVFEFVRRMLGGE